MYQSVKNDLSIPSSVNRAVVAHLVREYDSYPKGRGFESPGAAMLSCSDWFTHP